MYRLILSSILLVCISVTHAAPDDSLDVTLQQKQSELNSLTKSVEAAIAKLADEQVSLQRHTEGLLEAQEKLDEAEADMKLKLLEAESNPDETAMRESVLASIRFNRYETRVNRYSTRKQESEATVAQMQAKLDTLIQQQKDLQSVIRQFTEQLAERKARAAQPVAAVQTPAPVAAPVQPKPVAPTPEPKPAPVAAAPETSAPGTWPYLASGSDQDFRFARTYLAELKADKAKGEIDSAPLPNVELVAKSSFGKASMEYIGEDLYMVTKTVKAGSQRFSLFKQEFWHTIPSEDDRAEYVFIFDVSSLSKPDLYLFNASLISE